MALRTLGTNATTSLSAFVVGANDVIPADLATLNTQLRGDPPGWTATWTNVLGGGFVTGMGANRPQLNGAYVKNGTLIIPNRGMLTLRNGDLVCWDTTVGWPIVISGDAALNGPYTHS